MKYFTTIANSKKTSLIREGLGIPNFLQKRTAFVRILFFLLITASFFKQEAFAQCSTTSSIMAQWNMNSTASACNKASGSTNYLMSPYFTADSYKYCPNINSGCAQALLGSKCHVNTANFNNAICLLNFYDPSSSADYGGCPFDVKSTVWDPSNPVNLYISYILPAEKKGCITNFDITILEKQFYNPTTDVAFEKQGVAVYRNGVLIPSSVMTQTILASNVNGTPIDFAFPSTGEYCSDGSAKVEFTIVFGLVHQLNLKQIGYDNITIMGTCGSSPTPVAAIKPATCSASGSNADGSITLSNFGATDTYQYSTGATFNSASATPTTAAVVPTGGVIVSNLPNPPTPQDYTVRVYVAGSSTCYTDLKVTLNPVICPNACTAPTGTVTPTMATCGTTSANNDAKIAITGVTGGDKVGISPGSSYTGSLYGSAQTLTSNAYTFTGLANPNLIQVYTVRIFNAADDCFKDYQVTLTETSCGACKKVPVEVICSDQTDPDSAPNNGITTEDDFDTYEVCKDNKFIDLKLTKTVTPTTGATCPTNTDFVWTLTLKNVGTMDASGIQIADILPDGLVQTATSTTTGTYGAASGWMIPSLAAGATATLTITTKALVSGTFKNCAEVVTALPLNDPNSTPGNGITTEDDYACATITVTGSKTPEITKEFSPWAAKPNVPVRLTIKITNNEATPITTTAALIDNLPSTPAQMTIAATPNLVTNLTGVVATANGTSITIPSGTVLLPGLNQIQVDVIAPSNGDYCNNIAAGALKTTSCDNLVGANTCININNTNVLAPLISKTMSPAVVNVGASSTLTITVENRNAAALTIGQDFIDNLPTGLVLAGAASGTCSGVSTFGSTDQVGLTAGTVLAANSTCTIVVPVKSTTAGKYCNFIPANSLIGTVSGVMTGNEDHAEACVTVNATPCTTIDLTSITQAPTGTVTAGSAVNLTAVGTGIDATKTVFTWSNTPTGGTFSTQANPTVWTAPTTAGTYIIKVVGNNSLTGYGTCKDSVTLSATVGSTPVFDLALMKKLAIGQSTTVTAGSTVKFTISIINQGNVDATNVQVTDYIPTGLTLNDANWTSVSGKATLNTPIATLAAGTTVTRDISFTVGAGVTGTITNYSEISSATGGTDIDSTPDANDTNDGTPKNDVVNEDHKNNPTQDEDDHDLEAITVTSPVCVNPTFKSAAIQATCSGTTANSDAKISLTNIVNGDKASYSVGNTYTGSTYNVATVVSGGSVIFSGINNLSGNNVYTVRVFNGSDACYIDKKVIIPISDCNTLCMVDGGNDIMICTPTSTADFKDALANEEWIVGTGNPTAATINASTGVISGMTVDGIYSFILQDKTNAACFDIVYVFRSLTVLPTLSSCETSYQLPTDGGITWTVAAGNTASVTSGGLITGMSTNGIYTFNATFGTCSATVDVAKVSCACITPNAGTDFTMCLPKTTANLIDATSGYEWVAVAGNPATAVINASTGVVSGITAIGIYKFRLQKVGDATCFDEIQITVTNGNAPIVLCNDGSTSYTLNAQSGLTNVIWYNMAGVQVGTGSSLIVKSTTLGLADGSEAYYYVGQSTDPAALGCDVELCCPVKFMRQTCCPVPNCVGITIIKN